MDLNEIVRTGSCKKKENVIYLAGGLFRALDGGLQRHRA